jgi:hypothetical protein
MRSSVALLLALSLAAAADVVHLKTGKSLEGAAAEDGDDVVVKFPSGGTIRVARDQVDWVELSDAAAAAAELKRRRAPGTAEALVDAARWAEFHGMKEDARKAYGDAIAKDPSCKAAHEALGHRLHEGTWLTEEEWRVATGHVRHDGRWITKDEKAKLDAGWEFVEGKLLSPDDAKRARGLVLHEGKWIPREELEEIEARRAAAAREEAEAEKRRHDPKDDEAILAKYGKGWRIHVGKRYRLVTNVDAPPEEFDHKLVAMIDGFWNHYCETFDVRPVQKTLHNVVVYATQEQYDKAPGAAAGAYGVYQHGDAFRPAVLWYMEKLRGSSFTTRHECGHQFVAHYVRQDGGAWFSEGIATTFECVGDVPFQDHLYRWEQVRKRVVDPGGFQLADMISGREKETAVVYCLGAAAHNFFLTGKERAYRAAYQKYLKTGDTKSVAALEKAVGRPIAEIQSEFEAWVKDLDGKRTIFPPKQK